MCCFSPFPISRRIKKMFVGQPTVKAKDVFGSTIQAEYDMQSNNHRPSTFYPNLDTK